MFESEPFMSDRHLSRQKRWSVGLLYAAFASAGAGCALPGALLPAMLVSWHLQDSRAGLLFLVIAAGSALGALAMGRRLWHSLILGCALLTLAALAWSTPQGFVVVSGFAWGVGLGMMMTSITLIRQQIEGDKTVELVRLNLLWAAGACLCPILLTHALRAGSLRGILLVFAAVFAALGVGVSAVRPGSLQASAATERRWPNAIRERLALHGAPFALIVATALSTGVEASAGAWLAAYAQRSRDGLAVMIAAPTCLWAGLLVSRALGSLPGRERKLQRSFKGLLVLAALAALGLLLPSGAALLVSAFCLGFGLGPIYPSLLAKVIGYRQNGSIFFLCGVTSALMPLLTGILSTQFASLRAGLSVLTVGALAMLLMGLRLPETRENNLDLRGIPLPEWDSKLLSKEA